jgi:hypothetical protein
VGRHDGGAAEAAATNAQDIPSSTRPPAAQGGADRRVHVRRLDRTKPCGDFVYLGTQLDPTCSATPEVRRRCGMACSVFDSLNILWRSSNIATDVKGHLFCALVLSVMCCDAEVWPITDSDAAYLESAHFRLLRRIVAKAPDEHVSRARVLRLTDVPPLSALLCQKRLRWVGHALRRGPTDRSLLNVRNQLTKMESRWTHLVMSDCAVANNSFEIRQFRTHSHRQDNLAPIVLCTYIPLRITRIHSFLFVLPC